MAFFAVLERMLGVDIKSVAAGSSLRLRAALGKLLRRAQAAGAVRKGIGVAEVLALMAATASAARRTGTSVNRLFAIVRDGLRA